MARLNGFDDYRPPQGVTYYCGPAAVVCACRYLGLATCDAITTPEALAEAVAEAGVSFDDGGGREQLVEFARTATIGATAVAKLGGITGLHEEILASINANNPVLIQWRPRFMGLENIHGDRNHWSLIVEWPDDGEGQVELADPCMDLVGATAGARQWTLQEMTGTGLGQTCAVVFIEHP